MHHLFDRQVKAALTASGTAALIAATRINKFLVAGIAAPTLAYGIFTSLEEYIKPAGDAYDGGGW